MSFVYHQGTGYDRGAPFDPSKCAASVSDNQRFPRYHQCERKPVLFEPDSTGGEEHGWCKTHAPSSERARRDKSDAAYRAKINNSPEVRAARYAKRVKALEKAIELHLAGHNAGDSFISDLRDALREEW